MSDFLQHSWNPDIEEDCRRLVRLALAEDLGGSEPDGQTDWTTRALVDPERTGTARVVAREPGIAAGLPVLAVILDEAGAAAKVTTSMEDGDQFRAGAVLAELRGNVRHLLMYERTLLNFLGWLTGIATLTEKFVAETSGTSARIYDTRKTTPGWRRLEKYAVRCGGGRNHRTGLFDAVLIKDNHLAQGGAGASLSPAAAVDAVERARRFLDSNPNAPRDLPIEIEVDSLEQLAAVLPAQPDIVLLDNMTPEMLKQAVAERNRVAPQVLLEASGGARLETLRELALAGVDRISVGALTHSARSLDVGLDWIDG